jgi:hypothetical protein
MVIPLHNLVNVRRENCVLQVKGVIFDSAPGKRRITSLFRAIAAIVGGPTYWRIPAAVLITTFLALVWLFEVIARSLKEKKSLQTYPDDLAEEPFSWPQLFLYSTTDKLILYKDIEKFAERRRQRGVNVSAIRFDDSPHVKHFFVHREIYINTICSFLHSCLSELGDCPGGKSEEPKIETDSSATPSASPKHHIQQPTQPVKCD